MELKLIKSESKVFSAGAFNRTRMELKQFLAMAKKQPPLSFNRTRMELKQGQKVTVIKLGSLLIVPEWN